MANAESEPDLFPAREPPPRALTRLSPLVRRIVAPNASPFTFNGACTYIVGEGAVAIVDPGPDDEFASRGPALRHRGRATRDYPRHPYPLRSQRRREQAQRSDRRASGRSRGFHAARRGDGGLDASHDRDYSPDAILADGERLNLSGFSIEAVATPGHCANHLCFALLEEGVLFSGDHVMAWSTSVIAPPDGSMRAYMDSLEKLRRRDEKIYWPGHGGPVLEPQRYLRALIHHRRQREASILAALGDGARRFPRSSPRFTPG